MSHQINYGFTYFVSTPDIFQSIFCPGFFLKKRSVGNKNKKIKKIKSRYKERERAKEKAKSSIVTDLDNCHQIEEHPSAHHPSIQHAG